MRTYEVTVKTPAIYGRDGAGIIRVFKQDAGSRKMAAAKAIASFQRLLETPTDRVGYTMFLTIVRVN